MVIGTRQSLADALSAIHSAYSITALYSKSDIDNMTIAEHAQFFLAHGTDATDALSVAYGLMSAIYEIDNPE